MKKKKTESLKTLHDFTATWNCRFHPTDGWHEVGCPHKTDWTRDQLQEALNKAKQSNAYIVYLLFVKKNKI